MQTVFRKAVSADAPAMAELLVLAWRKAYRGILSGPYLDHMDAAKISSRISSTISAMPDFTYFLLVLDGRIIGISGCCPYQDDDLAGTMEIVVFYIHPDYQRQGHGRALMRHTLAQLLASGRIRVALWVLQANHSARQFYETMGFRADGGQKTLPHLENASTVRYQYVG